MKLKIRFVLPVLMLGILLAGCGKKASDIEIAEQKTGDGYNLLGAEEESEEPEEEPKQDWGVQEKEEKPIIGTDDSVVSNGSGIDFLSRIYKFVEAYNYMLIHEEEYAYEVQENIEDMRTHKEDFGVCSYSGDVLSGDGLPIDNNFAYYGMLTKYYFDYTNWITENYYQIEMNTRYVNRESVEEALLLSNTDNRNLPFSSYMMLDAATVADYLAHCELISLAQVKSLNDDSGIVLSGYSPAYEVRLGTAEVISREVKDENGDIIYDPNDPNNSNLEKIKDFALLAYFDYKGNLMDIKVDTKNFPEWNKYKFTKDTCEEDVRNLNSIKFKQ